MDPATWSRNHAARRRSLLVDNDAAAAAPEPAVEKEGTARSEGTRSEDTRSEGTARSEDTRSEGTAREGKGEKEKATRRRLHHSSVSTTHSPFMCSLVAPPSNMLCKEESQCLSKLFMIVYASPHGRGDVPPARLRAAAQLPCLQLVEEQKKTTRFNK